MDVLLFLTSRTSKYMARPRGVSDTMYDLYPQNWNDEGSRLATPRVEADSTPRRRAKVAAPSTPDEVATTAPNEATTMGHAVRA